MAGKLTAEEWRPVPNFEGLYEVSSNGRVRSLARYRKGAHGAPTRVRERILRQGGSRYPMVVLFREGRRHPWSVHRLVALAFLPIDPSKPEVNHLDGVRTNNHVSNLEWSARSENVTHSYRTVGRQGWKRAA